MEIRKEIPGLKQAKILAIDSLTKKPARNGYSPVPHTPYIWRHHTSDLVFSIVVDNFETKYTRKEDAEYQIKSLREDYAITKD